MGILVIIAVLALSSWSVFATIRRLRRTHAGRAWWFTFGVMAFIGLVAGYWLAFNFEYNVSPSMRFFSFPIPLVFFQLEDGQWVDFVIPRYIMYPGLVANVIAIVALALLPLLLASFVSGRKHRA